ncbi:MAG: hypothetical protein RDU25_00715 [Patescibacteria group bacterium]|nr:hypothetical protein [Patescibacteria group bacterium]
MSEVIVLRDRIFGRSLRALRDVEVRMVSGPELQIGLKAYGDFSSRSCDGRFVALRVHTIFDIREIRGQLVSLCDARPWYKFSFRPDNPSELLFVLDWEQNHMTNVERVVFEQGGATCFIRNPFFKDVSLLAE